MSQERILIVIEDGQIKGISQTNEAGTPTAVDISNLTALVASLNGAALARVSAIESEIETLNTDHKSALEKVRAEEKKKRDDLIAAHAEEIAALQGLPAPSVQGKISALSEAFKSQIPAEYQTNPDLLMIFAIVNVLINAGESGMAAVFIQNAVVPPELEALKPAFVALINPPEPSE